MSIPSHRELVAQVIDGIRRDVDPLKLTATAYANLKRWRGVDHVIAIGKAAATMAQGVALSDTDRFRDWANWRGPIVVPVGTPVPDDMRRCKTLYFAGHPLPTEASRSAALTLRDDPAGTWRELQRQRPGEDLVDVFKPRIIVLLSGGASSLVVDPPMGVSVDEYRKVVQALLRRGASIQELNTVRRHIDLVKGGWLAKRFTEFPVRLLVLSDVLGDDLASIGSGPFSADPSTYTDAIDVLEQFDLLETTPPVTEYLRAGARGEHPETPKPGDPAFDNVLSNILANNATAVASVATALIEWNIAIAQTRRRVGGEARIMGRALADEVIRAASLPGKTRAIVWGGETTVDVENTSGTGGRNLEFALAAAIGLDGVNNITVATFATDGVDGPTDAAGAIITGETCSQARSIGQDPGAFLEAHDSYTFFQRLDQHQFPHLIRTGPTGTNVNDVALALIH